MAKGQRSARGGARLHPGTRVVSAGGRDPRACPGPVWSVAVLCGTGPVAHGARAGGHVAAPGATCRRPRARCRSPTRPSGTTWFFLGALPAARRTWSKASHCYDARPAPCAGLPYGQRSGGGLPRLCGAGPCGCWAIRSRPWRGSTRRWPWPTSWRIPIVWRCAVLAAYVHQCRRDVPAVHEQAEAAIALSTEQGFPFWAAAGTILRGWALAMQGQGEAGMAQMRQGLAAYRATGAALLVAVLSAPAGGGRMATWATEDGLQVLAEALTLMEQQEERYWEAEAASAPGRLAPAASREPGRDGRRKPVSSRPSTWPAARRRSRWSCGPP